ncbi:hypothetical protein BCR42DRAFT_413278 [Absidia repens]|uniref:Uncharacterized protein n=1 Tax=Absidia repens TaxID=90262 RepID=A0A1X2IKU1_9FUNG|nr:hypothetical protein BCR42DRAFT_413278 [Absidia repens]
MESSKNIIIDESIFCSPLICWHYRIFRSHKALFSPIAFRLYPVPIILLLYPNYISPHRHFVYTPSQIISPCSHFFFI